MIATSLGHTRHRFTSRHNAHRKYLVLSILLLNYIAAAMCSISYELLLTNEPSVSLRTTSLFISLETRSFQP